MKGDILYEWGKTGKLIAQMRKEKGLMQSKLADMLGVTDKSVSKWENGICLPDVSLYKKLCSILGITLNDFFAGEKIDEKDYKEVANENLFKALAENEFNLEEKYKFYKRKWFKENIYRLIISFIIWVFGTILIKMLIINNIIDVMFGMASGIYASSVAINILNTRTKYIEDHLYSKKLSNKKW